MSLGILFGMLAASVGLFATILYMKRKTGQINARGGCPGCSADVPAFRWPTSLRQALRGGWTCEECGLELDRNGCRDLVAG